MIQLIRIACVLLCALILVSGFSAAAVAQTAAVRGRVEDAVTRSAIVGASMTIEGLRTVITNERGEFRFSDVPIGSHLLRVEGLGYSPDSVRFDLRADTALDVALNPRPVHLDSLRVVTRWVDVNGRLSERANGRPIMDGAVFASQKRFARSSLIGQFEFKRVPAGSHFEVQVVAFPYEPILISFVPERDTTLSIALVPDTMVHRLIRGQARRLERRLVGTPGRGYSIAREDLITTDRGLLIEAIADALKYAKYSREKDPRCFIVDEKNVDSLAVSLLGPEEVERVEYLFNGAMLRVYTRRFMANMVSSEVKLARPVYAQPPTGMMGSMMHPSTCG